MAQRSADADARNGGGDTAAEQERKAKDSGISRMVGATKNAWKAFVDSDLVKRIRGVASESFRGAVRPTDKQPSPSTGAKSPVPGFIASK